MILALALALTGAPEPAPLAVVAAMFDAFNRHDAAAMAKLYAADVRLTSSDFCHPRGRADVERTYRALFAEFPDIRDEVAQMVAEGDRVAVRFTAVSRKAGMRLPIQTMLRVRAGLIVEDDTLFDTGGRPCQP
ncbi:uncharacterized protein (TIGR02246 family) [Sphingomonas naasensis]|uniref:Nuclear transport factor 2 family protein n=1 Tax=Sphingomonas naasensis TaxID=1344951 RepID=A0A4S1WB21_9SPHN|nr:nuclear transport factor 2 family protein [Sphingomonas naasensis]NIJ21212.1 uncharacterized protein (TIGR02246 family) [Sphingomonas naasensis]TGX38657.1 nuclear transport factor 2 family protein [Sphingomonas naasensis]